MLPRQHRLTKKFDFQKVLKAKKFVFTRFFSIAYLAGQKQETKIGIIVSNKVSKKATERNRIKRTVRESIRPLVENLPVGLMIVVLTKNSSSGVENTKLKQDIRQGILKLQ